MAVTEGEDKCLKYPTIFNSADAVLLTKMDLAGAVEFKRAEALANLRTIRADLPVIESSCRTPLALDSWFRWLSATAAPVESAVERFRSTADQP